VANILFFLLFFLVTQNKNQRERTVTNCPSSHIIIGPWEWKDGRTETITISQAAFWRGIKIKNTKLNFSELNIIKEKFKCKKERGQMNVNYLKL
jgi:hypothetical protein